MVKQTQAIRRQFGKSAHKGLSALYVAQSLDQLRNKGKKSMRVQFFEDYTFFNIKRL